MDDSMVIDFEDTELTAVNDLLERTQQRLLREAAKETEQYLRRAIEATDWDVTTVLDVVAKDVVERTTPEGEGESFRPMGVSFTTYRYRSVHESPESVDRYHGYVGHGLRVYRITEQVCREVGIDPETGCDDSTTSESSLSRTTVRDCDVDD